jgi:hypothetical protein
MWSLTLVLLYDVQSNPGPAPDSIKSPDCVSAYVNQSFKCEPMKELTYIAKSGLHQLWLKIQVMNFR